MDTHHGVVVGEIAHVHDAMLLPRGIVNEGPDAEFTVDGGEHRVRFGDDGC